MINLFYFILIIFIVLFIGFWYLSYVPPTRRVRHKAFFKVVWALGCSPDPLGIPKNAPGLVGILPKSAGSGTRR